MSLEPGKSFASMVNVKATECSDGRFRVKPGAPDASYLVDKLNGVDLCSGTRMPKSGGVSSGEIQTIVNWICAGAPPN
jgi:hypothetical protein